MNESWPTVSLFDVTQDVKSWDPSSEREFTYVDISSIDNDRCEISNSKVVLGPNAPSRARRPIKKGDVLFSNVRTYLRNVAQVGDVDQPAVASTGFTVLRPSPELDSRFLYHLVRSDDFINRVTPEQTGTHYPATSDRVVRSQKISLPSLPEQREIAEAVDWVELYRRSSSLHLIAARSAIERFRHSALAAACSGKLTADWRTKNQTRSATEALENRRASEARRLGKRYLRSFEPDPGKLPEIPNNWLWVALPELGELGRGKSKHRPRNDPKLYGGEYPFVQTGEIARSGGRITSHSQTYNETGLAQSRLWPVGTVCITIAANIADSGLLTFPACFPDSVVGLIADETIVLPEYAELFIRTARRDLAMFAPATAQANINLAILSEVAVAIPPIEEQHEIIRRTDQLFRAADDVMERIDKAARRVDRTSQAVLTKALRGELRVAPELDGDGGLQWPPQ